MLPIQSIPPTPTPYVSDGSLPELNAPSGWVWEAAPDAVGIWNQANSSGFLTGVQVFAIIVFAMIGLGLFFMVIRQAGE